MNTANNKTLVDIFKKAKDRRGCSLKFISEETGIEYNRILAIFSLEHRNPILSASELLALSMLFIDDVNVRQVFPNYNKPA